MTILIALIIYILMSVFISWFIFYMMKHEKQISVVKSLLPHVFAFIIITSIIIGLLICFTINDKAEYITETSEPIQLEIIRGTNEKYIIKETENKVNYIYYKIRYEDGYQTTKILEEDVDFIYSNIQESSIQIVYQWRGLTNYGKLILKEPLKGKAQIEERYIITIPVRTGADDDF